MNDIKERAANLLNAISFIKEADALSGGAIGAGIGGLAGGAGKYLLGDKKKSGLRNFTEGALGGAAVGGAVGAGAGHYAGGKKKMEMHDHPTKEELNKEDTDEAQASRINEAAGVPHGMPKADDEKNWSPKEKSDAHQKAHFQNARIADSTHKKESMSYRSQL
jgi:hypothetical protein